MNKEAQHQKDKKERRSACTKVALRTYYKGEWC